MFDFKNGMLGVVIITLAIAGSLFGSYLAGIDTEEVEVTKYDYLADVSGLFQYDESPQYISFDPSTNYTGYYSDNSYSSEMSRYYFAEDEVDFKQSSSVNNYSIDIEPLIGDPKEYDSSDSSVSTLNDYYRVRWIYNDNGDYQDWINKPYRLKEFIEGMDIGPEYTNVVISMGEDVDWNAQPDGGLNYHPITLDAVFILPDSVFFKSSWIPYDMTYLTSPDRNTSGMSNADNKPVNKAFQSYDINLSTWLVKCYYQPDLEGNWVEYKADSLLLCCKNTAGIFDINDVNLSSIVNYQEFEFFPRKYLDPNEGVWLKE